MSHSERHERGKVFTREGGFDNYVSQPLNWGQSDHAVQEAERDAYNAGWEDADSAVRGILMEYFEAVERVNALSGTLVPSDILLDDIRRVAMGGMPIVY